MSMSPISAACWLWLSAASHSRMRGGLASAGASTGRGELAVCQPVATLTATQASDPAVIRGVGAGLGLAAVGGGSGVGIGLGVDIGLGVGAGVGAIVVGAVGALVVVAVDPIVAGGAA